ncbi:TMV resistance protein N-like [Pistacia vera]|uniref:TMV resistance protein N-like n=1 Tax=Pistacia vera TaxID=55513 RepID=UPI001263675C|nr:TMV resistance protein N-like [Pistacia vera]
MASSSSSSSYGVSQKYHVFLSFRVIVFSKGYVTSRWCREELTKITECKKARDLMVVPVFYHVNPSEVRNQIGTFGEAFVNHEEKQSSEKVMRWRHALNETTNLSGFDSSNIR